MLLLLERQPADKDRQAQQDVHVHDNRGDDTPFDRVNCPGVVVRRHQDHVKQDDLDDYGAESEYKGAVGLFKTLGEDFGDFGDGHGEQGD